MKITQERRGDTATRRVSANRSGIIAPVRTPEVIVSFPRSSGVLLHPTSLAGRFGIGDLGKEARRFADFLIASDQSLWQVLPLGPTGFGDSPYQCFSSFASNPLLISPEWLVEDGLLAADDIKRPPRFPADAVDFGRVIDYKAALLRRAFENFRRTRRKSLRAEFVTFIDEAAHWLDDYALFRALKDAHGGAAWNTWEPPLARRDAAALADARRLLADQIEAQKLYQFLFHRQWSALKGYCNQNGIKIIGDIPIFVAYDSADVWANPDLFKLNEDGSPRVVAGVPPDYFSKTGQLWGNPIYNWQRHRATGYRWWIERLRATLSTVDVARIDHFRGFAATWEVPAGDQTAERGQWVEVPGRELFTQLREEFGEMPIIAEDLGVITPDVQALRDDFGFPGMRILQFGFRNITNTDLPHNYVPNTVVYTGTHDNDTAVGWFNSTAGRGSTRTAAQIEREKKFCMEYLNTDGREINWDFIRAAQASVACMAITPAQDLLGLGSQARMNLPASTSGNWRWRMKPGALTKGIGKRLRHLTQVYVRGRSQPKHTTTD
ncbi:MAG TPA: 4-alpha-glucanotransferase [Blastocatellia bacterium]|nr:4-alpha-glucanotransferase [Blastocatellia bacterium]